jgi:heptosyltransferase-2
MAFDAAFILRRSLSRTLLLAAAGIPERIGFDNLKSGWLLTRRIAGPAEAVHKAATYLPLLHVVGPPGPLGTYDYVVTEEERGQAGALLRGHGLLMDQPVAVLHPGANWAHKRWAPESFAELGDRLIRQHNLQVIITGGPADLELAKRVVQRMEEAAAMLVGQTTLRQLAACLERARLVVANDTGVLHVAAALRRPAVALYGPTSPALTGPLGDPARTTVLHHADCCPRIPCYAPDRPSHPGMESITVEEAYTACRRLLEKTQEGQGAGDGGRDTSHV